MAHHSFKLSTIERAIRAAQNVGAKVDRVEISSTGSVFLHMAGKPADAPQPIIKQPQAGSRTGSASR